MRGQFYFFAYGASMNPVRLASRTSDCEALGVGRLVGHRLAFHKRCEDDEQPAGEADAYRTGSPADEVFGVLYRVGGRERDALDVAEGVESGYRRVTGKVQFDGRPVIADYYVAEGQWIVNNLHPYDWYLALLSSGARVHALPMAYQRMLRRIPTIADPDRKRAERYFRSARKSEVLVPFPRRAIDS